jgi:hypothetical protein
MRGIIRSFLWRLLGLGNAGESRCNDVTLTRSSPHPVQAAAGEERRTYIQQIAVVVERPAETIELSASLTKDYGCADMDVSECVQVAEEIWSVSLMPNPMRESDYADMMKRFPTLQAIVEEAEGRKRQGG